MSQLSILLSTIMIYIPCKQNLLLPAVPLSDQQDQHNKCGTSGHIICKIPMIYLHQSPVSVLHNLAAQCSSLSV